MFLLSKFENNVLIVAKTFTYKTESTNIINRKFEWRSLLPQGILLSGSPD